MIRGTQMIVEYTRYKIEEGRRKSFEETYQKAANALRASSHSLAYELSHCTEDLNYYTLRIERDSEEGHLKGFRSSSEIQGLLRVGAALREAYRRDASLRCAGSKQESEIDFSRRGWFNEMLEGRRASMTAAGPQR